MLVFSKRMALIAVDAVAVNLAMFLALLLRFDGRIPVQYLTVYGNYAWPTTVVAILVFYAFGFYRRLWRYTSLFDLVTIVLGASTVAVLQLVGFYATEVYRFPRSVIILTWLLTIFLIGGSRLSNRLRWTFKSRQANGQRDPDELKRVLIIGAGDAGEMVLRELLKRPDLGLRVVGFADDDITKHGRSIHGVPVLGAITDVPQLTNKFQIQQLIIAIPSAPRQRIRKIIEICYQTRAEVKILPGVYELIDGKVTINHIKKVELEDLLGREPVKVNIEEIAGYLSGEIVLVTGAGGSIGSELCRQVAQFVPKRLLLLGHGENSIFEIHNELTYKYSQLDIVPVIADIQDQKRIDQVFAEHRPTVVFHAAAHKHVPLMELNPTEAVKNNVIGTLNVAEAADKNRAKRFVLISTDKAVNPTSVMGATKRVAEIIIQTLGRHSATRFCAVRFGNVLGSRGSVVPLFRQQIARGGPVTVTHPDMTRYFMTIPEAVQLVIQAGAMAESGEIFILDMGEPVKIVDLARQMIKLSGFEPEEDIKIEFTGIRPGEKLKEETISEEEDAVRTKHEQIFVLPTPRITRADIDLMQKLADEVAPNTGVERLLEQMDLIVRELMLPSGLVKTVPKHSAL